MQQLEEVRAHLHIEKEEGHCSTQGKGRGKQGDVLWERRRSRELQLFWLQDMRSTRSIHPEVSNSVQYHEQLIEHCGTIMTLQKRSFSVSGEGEI